MTIKSNPDNAEVKIYSQTGLKDKVRTDTIYKIKNTREFFTNQKVGLVLLEANKEGYQTKPVLETIQKNKPNELNTIRMEPLNTTISINSDPPGASFYLYDNIKLASDDIDNQKQSDFLSKEVIILPSNYKAFKDFDQTRSNPKMRRVGVTPWETKITEKSAKQFFSNIRCIKIEKEGYIPIIQELNIRPGDSNVFSVNLKEMSTTLKVISEPEGVEVVDLNKDSSFGYLGKTPFVKTFTYKDCYERKDIFWRDGKVFLTLEATKKGYENEYRKYEIPFGDEMTVKFHMKNRSTQITFQTDPSEAHVYVYRIKEREVWDEATKTIKNKPLRHLVHLGTTPFTYYMDPADPLEHDDQLIFRKPGFRDSADKFKSGVNSYHMVLEPKGAISHDVEVN